MTSTAGVGPTMDVPVRLGAALADRYAIARELGHGAMATVYLARDLKHEREVALKVLRPELAAVLGSERFLREIRITAKLSHPHILPLLDSGEAAGFLYYVMPYVEGESLRQRLEREGQLPLGDALALTRQLASALDCAHQQGIVHRDIKPENILLHGGEAVLADFGIALAVRAAGGPRLTDTGLSLGTPQYMSPEQAAGDREVDARSDVYSLGAVLYELLAGEPPVTGPTVQAVMAKLLTERPTRLRVVRDTVPEGIESAVAKALAKVPADRFAGAAEFAAALAAGSGPAERAPRRVAATGWLVAAGVLVVAVFAWAIASRGGEESDVSRFLAATPVQLTTSGRAFAGVPSPDGLLIAYSEQHCEGSSPCRGDLVIRETAGEGASTPVSLPGHGAYPTAWSPDGRSVAFWDVDVGTGIAGGLYIVSQRGSAPRRVAPGTADVCAFVSPDTLVVIEGARHWLKRVVASTGAAVDSVMLSVGRYVNGVWPSPDGARLLVKHQDQLLLDSARVSVVDRNGHVTDSLDVPSASSGAWAGAANAVVLLLPAQGGTGLVFVRRRLDGRGRFLPGSDTLRTLTDGSGTLLGVSADGTQLFYQVTRASEAGFWTATRSDARGAFTRGRRIRSSTGALRSWLSPPGGWILSTENTTTPTGMRTRLAVEPFAEGQRHVLEPALLGFRPFAFAPGDDSLAVATDAGSGRTALTVYPLPSGASVSRGTFDGVLSELTWLSDGRLVGFVHSGRAVRVIGRTGKVTDFPVPDSLGQVVALARSPSARELAVSSYAVRGDRGIGMVHRLNLADGRYTLVARTGGGRSYGGGLWWTTDGWLHVPMTGPGDERDRLYRVPAGGGVFEPEPPIGFESNASVASLAQDGRRAVVRVQSENTDIWVLRAVGPK